MNIANLRALSSMSDHEIDDEVCDKQHDYIHFDLKENLAYARIIH